MLTANWYLHAGFSDMQLVAYLRKQEDADLFLIILNFYYRPAYFMPRGFSFTGEVVVASSPERE